MTGKLLIYSIIITLFIILVILNILKKGRMNIKYSLVWLIAFGLLLISLLVPNLLNVITKSLGFNLSSNLIIVFFIGILVFINISLTIIISGQTEKIKLLIQEVSMLKKEVKENEKSKK